MTFVVALACFSIGYIMMKDSKLTVEILIVLVLAFVSSTLFAVLTRVFEEHFRKRMQKILVFTAIFIQTLFELYLVLARINDYAFNALEVRYE